MTHVPAPHQPQRGDTILSCGHESKFCHVWYVPPPDKLGFQRPDGTKSTANWIAACDLCYQACGGDPLQLTIKADIIYNSDKPAAFVQEIV